MSVPLPRGQLVLKMTSAVESWLVWRRQRRACDAAIARVAMIRVNSRCAPSKQSSRWSGQEQQSSRLVEERKREAALLLTRFTRLGDPSQPQRSDTQAWRRPSSACPSSSSSAPARQTRSRGSCRRSTRPLALSPSQKVRSGEAVGRRLQADVLHVQRDHSSKA